MPLHPDAQSLVNRLDLTAHPEGGFYKEIHRSFLKVNREDDGQSRAGLTAIYYLLPSGDVSRWHIVSGSDETWHYASGSPLELFRLSPDANNDNNNRGERLLLGPLDPSIPEQAPIHIIPAGWWMAAASLGEYTLVNNCVGPGFEFSDFLLLRDAPPDAWPQFPDKFVHYKDKFI